MSHESHAHNTDIGAGLTLFGSGWVVYFELLHLVLEWMLLIGSVIFLFIKLHDRFTRK